MMESLQEKTMLLHLSLASCYLTYFINVSLPNLSSLDLSNNHITCLCHVGFTGLKQLRVLYLSDNPLTSSVVCLSMSPPATHGLSVLDLAHSQTAQLIFRHFSVFPNLHMLNMSGCSTWRIAEAASHFWSELNVLDLGGCPVTSFSPRVFRELNKLQDLYAGGYRLCCLDKLPEAFSLHNCLAPSDKISDSYGLLKNSKRYIH